MQTPGWIRFVLARFYFLCVHLVYGGGMVTLCFGATGYFGFYIFLVFGLADVLVLGFLI
jgi:hypothetical protein